MAQDYFVILKYRESFVKKKVEFAIAVSLFSS
jgi:hypothetical protein